MKPIQLLLTSAALLFGLPAFGAEDPQVYAGKTEMSGAKINDFKDFEKKWKMVTVRFRKDTGELRFTYANESAWKALKAGGKSYPKGAVFAKIGLATLDDPSFESSAVPAGARRYQFMIRDEKKFKETDGWGYALFDQNGKTFPGEPKAAVLACAACHNIVPERTYVFSEIMELSPSNKSDKTSVDKVESKIKFETIKTSSLPKTVLDQIPPKTNEVRKIVGPLNELMFHGTLDEIRPTLYKEAIRSKMPSLLFNKSGTSFSIVILMNTKTKCAVDQEEVMSLIQNTVDKIVVSQLFCIAKET